MSKIQHEMGFVRLWFFDHCTLKTFDWPISLMGKISNTLVVNQNDAAYCR